MRLLFIPFLTVLTACGSAPKTPEAFKEYTKTSGYGEHHSFSLSGTSLGTVHQRLKNFANQCLRQSQKSTYQRGVERSVVHITYTPTIEATDSRVALFLQREDGNSGNAMSDPFGAIPKGGFYYFFAEAEKQKDKLDVELGIMKNPMQVGKLGAGVGKIMTDAEEWIRGKSEFCPALQ